MDAKAAVLVEQLSREPSFWVAAAHVAASHDRLATAHDLARAWVPYRTATRDAIAELLWFAGTLRHEPPAVRRVRLLNYGLSTIWADDPQLDAQLPQRATGPTPRLVRGAEIAARFGAGRCVECGALLADVYQRGHARRSARRLYCGQHEQLEGINGAMDRKQRKDALAASTVSLGNLRTRRTS